MHKIELSPALRKTLRSLQRNEITEHEIYLGLSKKLKDHHNRTVLANIARDEFAHYQFVFNFYIAVARDLPFRKRFLEMAGISLGVAALSFAIGYLVRLFLGVDV